jgi:hypothetical protein
MTTISSTSMALSNTLSATLTMAVEEQYQINHSTSNRHLELVLPDSHVIMHVTASRLDLINNQAVGRAYGEFQSLKIAATKVQFSKKFLTESTPTLR